jgi:hypothetical protein
MGNPRQEGEIHRADPAYRKQLWGWFAFSVLAGAVLLFALDRWLAGLRAGFTADQGVAFEASVRRVLACVCLLLAALAIAFGAWLQRLAAATRRDRRFPPVAMRTSQDVRVRYLTSADALVTQFRAGAFGLYAAALGLIGWAAWLLFAVR